jgi:hypothetical protein
MLSSSANVPLRLIATTESNMTFSFDESIRAMVSNMLKNTGEKFHVDRRDSSPKESE